jgi:hypothetical protein
VETAGINQLVPKTRAGEVIFACASNKTAPPCVVQSYQESAQEVLDWAQVAVKIRRSRTIPHLSSLQFYWRKTKGHAVQLKNV